MRDIDIEKGQANKQNKSHDKQKIDYYTIINTYDLISNAHNSDNKHFKTLYISRFRFISVLRNNCLRCFKKIHFLLINHSKYHCNKDIFQFLFEINRL